MKRVSTRFYYYRYLVVIVMILLVMSLKCATSRPLPPQNTTTTSSPLPQLQAAAGNSSKEQINPETETTTNKAQGVGVQEVIGSRPPRCEHRCNGCSPCEATQVPTNHHVGIQFTNYEPEGWKCKCGPSFFTP